jgi:protein TonB
MARRALMLREGRAPVWDRLLTMLFLTALVHGLIILGITFNAKASGTGGAPGLEVLLVSDELPESDQNPNATYLAQRTQVGSGNTTQSVTPHNRSAAVPRLPHEGSPQGTSLTESAETAGSSEERVITTSAWNTDVRYLADAGSSGAVHERPLEVDAPAAADPGPVDEQDDPRLKGPKNDDQWINADTQASTIAPYLDRWRAKVERIGTLNFPNAARNTGASANPLIAVEVSADGRIKSVQVRRSSGDAGLDQAALATLKLASPFDRFPPEMAAEHPVLRFEYEWQFSGGRLTGETVTSSP